MGSRPLNCYSCTNKCARLSNLPHSPRTAGTATSPIRIRALKYISVFGLPAELYLRHPAPLELAFYNNYGHMGRIFPGINPYAVLL